MRDLLPWRQGFRVSVSPINLSSHWNRSFHWYHCRYHHRRRCCSLTVHIVVPAARFAGTAGTVAPSCLLRPEPVVAVAAANNTSNCTAQSLFQLFQSNHPSLVLYRHTTDRSSPVSKFCRSCGGGCCCCCCCCSRRMRGYERTTPGHPIIKQIRWSSWVDFRDGLIYYLLEGMFLFGFEIGRLDGRAFCGWRKDMKKHIWCKPPVFIYEARDLRNEIRKLTSKINHSVGSRVLILDTNARRKKSVSTGRETQTVSQSVEIVHLKSNATQALCLPLWRTACFLSRWNIDGANPVDKWFVRLGDRWWEEFILISILNHQVVLEMTQRRTIFTFSHMLCFVSHPSTSGLSIS